MIFYLLGKEKSWKEETERTGNGKAGQGIKRWKLGAAKQTGHCSERNELTQKLIQKYRCSVAQWGEK